MSGLIELKDLKSGYYLVEIAKQHWNKGNMKSGFLLCPNTGEFISIEYIQSIGHDCMISIKDCEPISIKITKSQDRKDYLTKLH